MLYKCHFDFDFILSDIYFIILIAYININSFFILLIKIITSYIVEFEKINVEL